MIYSITGKLIGIEKGAAIIETGGVGYLIKIPTNLSDRLPSIGSELKFYTHHIVREDLEALYGFLNREERSLFGLLITVSGVGPKAATAIMSNFALEMITSAIVKGNSEILASAPGVGKKTAEKICIELREKLAKTLGVKPSEMQQAIPNEKGIVNDAVAALMTLGYSPKEAREAIFNSKIDLE
ncbi:Holliday junction DNA helicase RuvA, partial [candidate division WOR-1 bacterium RIFOXYA12_FULL_43_27]